MSEVKGSDVFKGVIWNDATPEQEAKAYAAFSKIRDDKAKIVKKLNLKQ